ncbi:MAG: hypothetical protein LH609_01640 [Rudanella sp.]|nr:hypothetical protein [Rudanella sp.]
MRLSLIVILACLVSTLYAQETKSLVSQAYESYQKKQYDQSISLYNQAFAEKKPGSFDLYNAACAAALANQADQAFGWLNQSLDDGWDNTGHLKIGCGFKRAVCRFALAGTRQ